MQTHAPRQGFAAGLRLVPESLRHLARMRNVWLVILLFAILHSHSRMGLRPLGDRPEGSFRRTLAIVAQTRYRWIWTHPHAPGYLVVTLLRGLQRPLNSRFVILQNPVTALADRIFGPQSPYAPPRGPRLSFEILLANLIYAALTAGLLGWILLSLRGTPPGLREFLRFVSRATGPIYCWFLLLDAVKLLITGLGPMLDHSRLSGETVQVATLLLLLPFAFLPFVVVAWEESIVTAFPSSLRASVSRLPMLLGFLIVFRIIAELCLVLSEALHHYGSQVVTSHVGRFAFLLASDLIAAFVALLLCTALTLIVLRRAPPADPQPAEATPA